MDWRQILDELVGWHLPHVFFSLFHIQVNVFEEARVVNNKSLVTALRCIDLAGSWTWALTLAQGNTRSMIDSELGALLSYHLCILLLRKFQIQIN